MFGDLLIFGTELKRPSGLRIGLSRLVLKPCRHIVRIMKTVLGAVYIH